MNKWQKVSDFVNFSTKGITPKYVESSSIIVLNQKCIRNGTINYSFSQFTDDTKQIQQSKFVQKGDILVNSTGTGTAGRCAFVSDLPENHKLIVDSHILILRCNSFYEAQCLSYSLFTFEKTLMSFMTGSSGQSELDKVVLMNLKTKIPTDKTTQQKIASFLSALDSKIQLNNRINAELEAMAKTIYDYWFVQFDFPDQNGKPYKANGGKMVWNEELKREIPEGWGVQKMEDWLNIDKSGDWGKDSPESNFTKKVICFRGADINGLNGFGELKPPVRFINEKNSFKILNSHDLIIEISGGSPTQSTGRMAFITDATIKRFEHPLICSNFCKPISMKNKKLLYNFVYYWNSLYDNGIFFGYEGKTSGIKNLLFDSFISSYSTVVPEPKVVEKFYNLMESIQEKKQTALAENQKLAELRDWLLPMLMNGQVKVKEATEYIQSPNNLSMAAEPEVGYGEKY
jgi:type I restriction enzyme, S subunit